MTVPNFMSKAFLKSGWGVGHYVPLPTWGMIGQKYPGADKVNIINMMGSGKSSIKIGENWWKLITVSEDPIYYKNR